MFKIDINTKAVVAFSNKLEKLSKTAMPKAVKYALNQAAFDVKTKTMPKRAADTFEKRSPNFFKANSKVLKAEGTDLRGMKATVGFTSEKLENKKTNFAVKDLEQQENGGRIGGRDFVPKNLARAGGKSSGLVPQKNKLPKKKDLYRVSRAKGANRMQKAIKTVVHAGPGAFVLNTAGRSTGKVWKIKSIRRGLNGNTIFEKEVVYSHKKNRNVKPKATHFMKSASLKSASKMEGFFKKEAERVIGKLMRR